MKFLTFFVLALFNILVPTSLFSQNIQCEATFVETKGATRAMWLEEQVSSVNIKRQIMVTVTNLGTQNAKALVAVKSTQFNDDDSSTTDTQDVLKVNRNSLNYGSLDKGNYYELKSIQSARAFYVRVDKSLFNATNRAKLVMFKIADRTSTSLIKNLSGYPNFQLNCLTF